MSAKLMEYFNKQPRIGTLSTAGKDGKVDVAYFGSPRMIDEKTIIMAVRKNQTFANLQENPNAAFMIMEQASAPPGWKGCQGLCEDDRVSDFGRKSGDNEKSNCPEGWRGDGQIDACRAHL